MLLLRWMRLVLTAYVVVVVTTTSCWAGALLLAPGPKLTLDCGGCTEKQPFQGNRATAHVDFTNVSSGASPPAWIRLDRCDSVDDNSFYHDWWPRWAKASDGSFHFDWLHATPPALPPPCSGCPGAGRLTVVASGWSARHNGTQLTANSTNRSIFFSFSYWQSLSQMQVRNTDAGSVHLTAKAGKGVNSSAADRDAWADTCQFKQYKLDTSGKYAPKLNFIADAGFHQTTPPRCWINVTFSQPCSVSFFGVIGIRNGISQQVASAGGDWDHACEHPTAIVTPCLNGTLPSLPVGFKGPVHATKPLRSAHQFAIINHELTVFSGAQIRLPIAKDLATEIPKVPQFATILAPVWLAVRPKDNKTTPTYASASLSASKVVAVGKGPATGNDEPRLMSTFHSTRWETYNDAVRMYLMFTSKYAGKTIPAYVFLHDSLDELEVVTQDPTLWQNLQLELVSTPDLRSVLGVRNTKLVTSVTWSSASLFYTGSIHSTEYSFLDTYARLGFNTVPGVGCCPNTIAGSWDAKQSTKPTGDQDVRFSFPANRTGEDWSGLQFGPEISGFGREWTFAKMPLNASLLPRAFVENQTEEMLKWERAKNFTLSSSHSMVDLAYDGAFLKADIADFCAAINASRPEWVFVDDEGWPAFSGWEQGCCSLNAEARRLPDETDFDLSWRMVSEFLKMWSDCLKDLPTASGGKTMIGYYGTTFPPGIFQPAGFVGMPSTYDAMKDLKTFAAGIQRYRRQMVAVDDDAFGPVGQLTERRQLLPWLTAACYGQMTGADVLSGALHSFAGGASGFAFFSDMGLDDPGKVLALSTAAGLAVAFEKHLLTGSSITAPDEITYGINVLASAGMRVGLDLFLVATPKVPGRMELTLVLPFDAVRALHGCELISGQSQSVNVHKGVAQLSLDVAGTVVLHLAPEASTCTATSLWYPRGQAGAVTTRRGPVGPARLEISNLVFHAPVQIEAEPGKELGADGFAPVEVDPAGERTVIWGPGVRSASYDSGATWVGEAIVQEGAALPLTTTWWGESSTFRTPDGRVHNLGAIQDCPPNGCWTADHSRSSCNNVTQWVAERSIAWEGCHKTPPAARSQQWMTQSPSVGFMWRNTTDGKVHVGSECQEVRFRGLPQPLSSDWGMCDGFSQPTKLDLPDGSVLATFPLVFEGEQPPRSSDGSSLIYNHLPMSLVVFRSTDSFTFDFVAVAANYSQIPGITSGPNPYNLSHSAYGPQENSMALLADNATVVIVFRPDTDSMCPGGPVPYKYYYQVYASLTKLSAWSVPTPIHGVGCVRPRMSRLQTVGTLLMTGGRLCPNLVPNASFAGHGCLPQGGNGQGGIYLWANFDGMADAPSGTSKGGAEWTTFCLGAIHNKLWQGDPKYKFIDCGKNRGAICGSQTYNSLFPIGDSSVGVVYQNGYSGESASTWFMRVDVKA